MPDEWRSTAVPGPWQPAVEAAARDLCRRLGLPPAAVAACRVADGAELAEGPAGSLAVWLVTGGETFRYLVDLTKSPAEPSLVSAPPWLRDEA